MLNWFKSNNRRITDAGGDINTIEQNLADNHERTEDQTKEIIDSLIYLEYDMEDIVNATTQHLHNPTNPAANAMEFIIKVQDKNTSFKAFERSLIHKNDSVQSRGELADAMGAISSKNKTKVTSYLDSMAQQQARDHHIIETAVGKERG